MKYSFETTSKGYVETLTVGKKEYKKKWLEVSSGHYKCEDKEFYEQLENDGYTDEDFLDNVCDYIDSNNFSNDLYSMKKDFGW